MEEQEIEFELDEETDTFHLLLDGEDQGPVDTESLRQTSGKLHMHFRMFREPPESPEKNYETIEKLSDEEVEEELQEVEEALEDVDD